VVGEQLEVVDELVGVVVGAEQVADHPLGRAGQPGEVERRDRALGEEEGQAQRLPLEERARQVARTVPARRVPTVSGR
jgi:hypothetical protein